MRNPQRLGKRGKGAIRKTAKDGFWQQFKSEQIERQTDRETDEITGRTEILDADPGGQNHRGNVHQIGDEQNRHQQPLRVIQQTAQFYSRRVTQLDPVPQPHAIDGEDSRFDS
jgi:hypothetical protein